MNSAMRTITVAIAKPNGKYSTKSQRFRIPAAQRRTSSLTASRVCRGWPSRRRSHRTPFRGVAYDALRVVFRAVRFRRLVLRSLWVIGCRGFATEGVKGWHSFGLVK
jgi:hypothetical protein